MSRTALVLNSVIIVLGIVISIFSRQVAFPESLKPYAGELTVVLVILLLLLVILQHQGFRTGIQLETP